MTATQVIKYFGSEAAAAKALGLTRQAVNFWLHNKGRVPVMTQAFIQIKTDGALRAKL